MSLLRATVITLAHVYKFVREYLPFFLLHKTRYLSKQASKQTNGFINSCFHSDVATDSQKGYTGECLGELPTPECPAGLHNGVALRNRQQDLHV